MAAAAGGLLLAVALAVPLQAQPGGSSPDAPAELLAKIEASRQPGASDDAGKSLAELMETHGIPALSLAVVEDYRLAWAKAYGVADESSGAPADTETLFQAASISKPLSAMAVLRAVQDGLFELFASPPGEPMTASGQERNRMSPASEKVGARRQPRSYHSATTYSAAPFAASRKRSISSSAIGVESAPNRPREPSRIPRLSISRAIA